MTIGAQAWDQLDARYPMLIVLCLVAATTLFQKAIGLQYMVSYAGKWFGSRE